MTDTGESTGGNRGDETSSASKRAQQAIEAAKDLVANTDLDQLRGKAGDAAAALYRSGRDLLESADAERAKSELRESIRRNPLAAVGIAFTAGLLLALLTRS